MKSIDSIDETKNNTDPGHPRPMHVDDTVNIAAAACNQSHGKNRPPDA